MEFGGLQKNSLIDYPEKISCVLFTVGCNFHCPYCHNSQLVNIDREKLDSINEDKALAFLNKRKGLLDGVVITGGEPTLHTDLLAFCRKIKDLGFSLKLDTNGSNPDILTRLLEEKLIDYVAMDIKSNLEGYFAVWKQNCVTSKICDSIKEIMLNAPSYEFRTTCVSPFIDSGIIKEIARTIKGARLFVLQKFCDTDLLDPLFFKDKKRGFSDKELYEFAQIAGTFVEKCIVR